MEAPDGSPPQSLCMIRAAELFPKSSMEKEDTLLSVPFKELDGESVKYLGRTDDGILALSNYRIFLLKNSNNSETSVPLGLIETAQTRDLFHLILNCKDASNVKCSFETAEQCSEWLRRIQTSIGIPETLETLFAFPFCSWTCEARSVSTTSTTTQNGYHNGYTLDNNFFNNPMSTATASNNITTTQDSIERLQRAAYNDNDFMNEVERLGFDLNGAWRISNVNQDFKLCLSYPQKLLVPFCISDETLQTVANFRGSRRLPAVVWRHRKSGAVIARCSQPEVGWLGWRNYKDEQLLKALADACAFDRGEQTRRHETQMGAVATNEISAQNLPSGETTPSSPDGSHEEVALDEVRKVLIVDARSYASAVTNRARGGGCECIEYYPCAEIEFMNLSNIHVIRKSFHALRLLCASPPDVPNWLGTLEKTMWLQHLSGLLAASVTVCHAIEKKGQPVLVHCSDGWDRTPQIVATAQLCLDPYYRTVEGFRVLVEREWLSYGHKFADRCGHGPNSDVLNERCPVFLQWLDLVHQIHKQFACYFEFSMAYLIKLAQHSLSCLFGTFLCNTLKERLDNSVFERTFSIWPFLSGSMYRNPLYVPQRDKVLWPAHNVRDLSLWTEVYLGSLGNQNSIDYSTSSMDGTSNSINPMFKTRSYGDLITSNIFQNGLSRRSSDPNMTVDPNLTAGSASENDSIADIQSEREDSPDLIANTAYDTSRKLQDLTTELNNHDDDNFKFLHQTTLSVTKNENYNAYGNANIENLARECSIDEQTKQNNEEIELTTTTNLSENGEILFSSLQKLNNLKEDYIQQDDLLIGCDLQQNSFSASPFGSVNSKNNLTSTLLPESEQQLNADTTVNELQNGFNKILNVQTENDCTNGTTQDKVHCTTSLTIDKTSDANLDLMQSVDLSDAPGINLTQKWSCSGLSETANNGLDIEQNLWHNSVNTSTDTLVPIENKQQQSPLKEFQSSTSSDAILTAVDVTDGAGSLSPNSVEKVNRQSMIDNSNSVICLNANILPKVHSIRPNNLSTSSTQSDVLLPCTINTAPEFSTNQNPDNTLNALICPALDIQVVNKNSTANSMEESIMILPAHQKLDISLNGKCETVNSFNNINNHNNICNNNNSTATPTTATTMQNNNTPIIPFINGIGTTAQRRHRTSSYNSRRGDGLFALRQTNGSTTSRFSFAEVRSLPLTPPCSTERQQLAISCPDGLAHALSEQNIRLQQIVYEHKLREESLRRELHDMRVALLKKQCPNCNNATATNDEQCSAMDNIENASICSWEAVDDRSGPSSCTSSSTQPNTTSVLWVPDHAVSRCTSCQTEFWLGRRKHHCRSCGQIFCADCSEFWAPLPLEKLFSAVRLCGPCYHNETTRMEMSQFQNNAFIQHHLQQQNPTAKTNNTATIAPQPQPAAATSKA